MALGTGRRLMPALDEVPVFFTAGDDSCFGVITRPVTPNGIGVMIIQGGDTVNVSMQRNRLAVRMARLLADRGFVTIRFDYHGLGESTGEIGELTLADPFSDDALAAADVLRREGAERVVLVGACFSARTALSAAPDIPDLAGVLASTPPIAGYSRNEAAAERMARDRTFGAYAALAFRFKTLSAIFDPTRRSLYLGFAKSKARHLARRLTGGESGENKWWVSPQLLDPLEEMARRKVPTLLVYGVDDPLLREFDRAIDGRLGRIIDSSQGSIQVTRDLPGVIHGFPTILSQEAFLETALGWIDEITNDTRV